MGSEVDRLNPADALTFNVSSLPRLLTFEDRRPVATAEDWPARRAELIELFRTHIYGQPLPAPKQLTFEVREQCDSALGGKAVRRQVRLRFSDADESQWMDLLIHLPRVEHAAPMFVGLNFHGNHTTHADTAIAVTPRWVRNSADIGPTENKALESSRGTSAGRWQIERIIAAGFGVATAYYGDLAPDERSLWRHGVYSLFRDPQSEQRGDDTGSIGAWARGLSRAMDYFEQQPDIDASRVTVMGHSRLGKTALWAGATDERFAGVISNESGCGGAALFRHPVGENIEKMYGRLDYWFCPNYNNFRGNERALPIDQHQLIALCAPRKTYVASAEQDLWADPVGTFVAMREASPAWELLGYPGLGRRDMPAVDEAWLTPRLGCHTRSGVHDVTAFDWDAFVRFMKQ